VQICSRLLYEIMFILLGTKERPAEGKLEFDRTVNTSFMFVCLCACLSDDLLELISGYCYVVYTRYS